MAAAARSHRQLDSIYLEAVKDPKIRISHTGKVWRKIRSKWRRVQSPGGHRNGKPRYYRLRYQRRWYLQIHLLVWTKHHGLPPPHLMVNHKDLDSLNNRLDNLELLTGVENARHYQANRGK